ncbi:MAG: TOTE conflict system archaeo-eukaryotic primase domain-containing protein [Bacilli bacterium]
MTTPNAQQIIDIFRPRMDAYAVHRDGHYGPARQADKQNRPLNLGAIEEHLDGQTLMGIYSTSLDDTCTWAAVDIDSHETATDEAKRLIAALTEAGFPLLLERSKSGQGYHVWLLLDSPVPAHKIRLVLLDIIARSGITTQGELKKERAYDRMFPSRDTLSGGEYGKLIALPFWPPATTKGNSLFLDIKTWTPAVDQLGLLQTAQRVTETQLDTYIEMHKLGRKLLRKIRLTGITATPITPEGEFTSLMHCAFIDYADNNRDSLGEQPWYALASNLAPFEEQGREFFHSLSEGHPEYQLEEADRKFDNALKAHNEGKQPVSCKKLSDEYGFTCPHLATCPARFVAEFPARFADVAMDEKVNAFSIHVIRSNKDLDAAFAFDHHFALAGVPVVPVDGLIC